MRPLGSPSTINSPLSSTDGSSSSSNGLVKTRDSRFDADSRSSGSTSTSYSSSSSSMVVARRNVPALTVVQTAAAGAATSLQSRDRMATMIAESNQVTYVLCYVMLHCVILCHLVTQLPCQAS
jgi:hypothetical protein